MYVSSADAVEVVSISIFLVDIRTKDYNLICVMSRFFINGIGLGICGLMDGLRHYAEAHFDLVGVFVDVTYWWFV